MHHGSCTQPCWKQSFQKDPIYRQLLTSLQFICFDNLKDALDLILNYINFKLIFVIISGSLYSDYYYNLKQIKKFIKCLPICVIFTSNNFKIILKEQKVSPIYNYLSKELYDSIENPFYNLGGVNFKFHACIKFIYDFWNLLQKDFPQIENEIIFYHFYQMKYCLKKKFLIMKYFLLTISF